MNKKKKLRLISRLDIKGENLIKGIHLEGLRVIGSPYEHAVRYYNQGSDELIFMDCVASLYGRNNITDIIKKHLEANNKAGGHTILIIDEAQLLAPNVLEQLRLLTNIETDHKKLLQIVLVGQPELQELLKRNELRQLAQRITARYHLLPLTQGQTVAYIKHRLHVAGCDKGIFSMDAMQAVHQLTGGVPRLMNLVCERALVGTFAKQQLIVDSDIIKKSAHESLPMDFVAPVNEANKAMSLVPYTLAFAALFAVGIGLSFIL